MPVNTRPLTGILTVALLAVPIVLTGCDTTAPTTRPPDATAVVAAARQPARLRVGGTTPTTSPAPISPADANQRTATTAPAAETTVATPSATASSPDTGAIVIIGASVSGGYKTSPGAAWPSGLAHRLQQAGKPNQVVNNSISATRLLTDNGPTMPSSLAREDKDALAVPGVRTIVLTDLINDIQQTPHQYDPAVIINGLRSFVAKAHTKDVKVVGTTIPPYGGFERYETAGEHCRQTVNDAIRQGHLFDSVIDFDATLKDPADPTRIRPAYDSGDHLHPNDAGHRAMTQSIDPKLFTSVNS